MQNTGKRTNVTKRTNSEGFQAIVNSTNGKGLTLTDANDPAA